MRRRVLALMVAGLGLFVPPLAWAPHAGAAESDAFTVRITPTDAFPPAAVADLAATPGSEGQVSLGWTAPDEDGGFASGLAVSSYTVKWATFSVQTEGSTATWWNKANDPAENEPSPLAPPNPQSMILNNLEPGATLWFAIKSRDEGGNESPIDANAASPALQATAVVPDAAPDAPNNLAASAGNAVISLSWDSVSNIDLDFYRIYVDSTSPHNFTDPFTIEVDSGTTAYNHTGLINGATYYYRVVAVDKGAPNFVGVALESLPSNTVSASPVGLPPAAPGLAFVSASTTTITWRLTDNANDETELYLVDNGLGRLSPNLGPLAGTGGTTTYQETGFTPNTAVTRRAEAFNSFGSSYSAVMSRYTLANPPLATQITAASSTTISLSWAANGNSGTTLYQVEYATDATFLNPSFAGATTLTAVAVGGLRPGTTYWLHVRARNGDNVNTAFDVAVTTVTGEAQDTLAPQAPYGLWAEWTAAGRVKIHWRPVSRNADGTPFDDPAPERYRVHRSNDLEMTSPQASSTDEESFEQTLGAGDHVYYRLRAVDAAGNESADSALVEAAGDGSRLNVLTLANDNKSRLVMPADTLARILLKEQNGTGDDLILKGVRLPEEEKGRVVASLQFGAYRVTTGELVKDFVFRPADATVMVRYEVQNGQVVQRSPGTGPGTPVVEAAEAKDQLSLFWHNGVDWAKVGGTVDPDNQTVGLQTARLGRYQIRQAIRVGPTTLTRVYPRVFTPNEDGWNDAVVFEFDNPSLAALKGDIYDITGAKVASLSPGPNPESSLLWDGKRQNQPVPAGVYIYQIEAGGETINGTVVVAR